MKFFERFRQALARYAAGVHDLGAPATEAAIAAVESRLGRKLPGDFRDFLAQWNGGWLFHDDYALFGVAGAAEGLDHLAVEGDLLHVGDGPAIAILLDAAGRVLVRDDETEDTVIEGSGFARWLDATMAREGLVYDRDGEFRDDAFDGGELADTTRRKRIQAALKADPDSPAWHAEAGQRFADEGDAEKARAAFEAAVSRMPAFAGAWLALGRIHREAKRLDAATAAFAHAGEAQHAPEEKAFAFAQAARAAGEGGLVEESSRQGKRAAEAWPAFITEQRAAAEHLVAEGDVAGAVERLSLATAVQPDDEKLRGELARLRARLALRPL